MNNACNMAQSSALSQEFTDYGPTCNVINALVSGDGVGAPLPAYPQYLLVTYDFLWSSLLGSDLALCIVCVDSTLDAPVPTSYWVIGLCEERLTYLYRMLAIRLFGF